MCKEFEMRKQDVLQLEVEICVIVIYGLMHEVDV